ncbi:MAG: 1,4-alpha-glucan branching enzyme, partial [Actinomycetia bacterium]|nr:1,4-alpha-glucan branching enzyme [Actinomycetes bacterium]
MPSPAPVSTDDIDLLVDGVSTNPHAILGAHPHEEAVTIRVLRPMAKAVTVRSGEDSFPMEHEHRGVWQVVVPKAEVPDYRIDVDYGDGPRPAEDPYRYLPTLGDVDLHLLGEGRHEQLWQALGAHTRIYGSDHGPVTGTSFAVWAPSARGVRVVGDFNYWDGAGHPMRSLGSSGIWELFVPDVGDGTRYKFSILGEDYVWRDKA